MIYLGAALAALLLAAVLEVALDSETRVLSSELGLTFLLLAAAVGYALWLGGGCA